ncbi:MAG: GTP cyclohydrolase II [Gammaproteobacteria bacterium]|nr:GTP cyclohydrolase II [Gammaproteobacteria bacterium]
MASTHEGINGHLAALTTERAVEELRRGRSIQLHDDRCSLLVAAVETLEPPLLASLQGLANDRMRLIMTAQRAQAADLAHAAAGPVSVQMPRGTNLDTLRSLAGLTAQHPSRTLTAEPVSADNAAIASTAFRLAKLGRLVPALLVVETEALDDPGLLKVHCKDLIEHAEPERQTVELVSRARVPLVDAIDCEVVLFRRRGELGQHLAIVIGTPAPHAVVPVRLHSACLTGDVLGSLRCDCGDQLKRAINRIGCLGSGVLLYLDQEGRGIGLANKLRAYALQDAGLDTLDADEHLGFLPDERDYGVAAAVLHELGIRRIRLMTNNPAKIHALERHGIEVAGRLPLVATVNAYNQRYLKAKLDRAGHLDE